MGAHAVEDRTEALLEHLRTRNRLLVLTHENPDPDSLASAMGLRHFAAERLGMPSAFAFCGRVTRAENQEMVRRCGIDMVAQDEVDFSDFDSFALVDTQPGFGHTHLPDGQQIDVVIDHHLPPEKSSNGPTAGFYDVRTYIGATSSIVTGYLIDAGVEITKNLATALFYGVKTDTADLSRNVSPLDEDAYAHLLTLVDREALAYITCPELPIEYYRSLRQALNGIRIYGSLILCSLGKVSAPEMVAEVADLLVRLEGRQTVMCGGLVGTNYYLSLRTELDRDAYYVMKGALAGEGSFGGHGSLAGGHVPLADGSQRTLKRFERRLEKNILQILGLENETLLGLGGERD